jgi:Protein of unknown function (DUF3438).
MALSDATVRQAKATGKDYTLGDSDGLSLGVTAAGGKSWHFRYSWAGKQKRMSLGTYPEVGLRQARSLRDEARRLIAEGTNPRVHRRHQRHTQSLAEQNTFQAMYDLWFAHRGRVLKKGRQSTLDQIALRRMGYFGLLTGHGMRGTLSTALHEIGYPQAGIQILGGVAGQCDRDRRCSRLNGAFLFRGASRGTDDFHGLQRRTFLRGLCGRYVEQNQLTRLNVLQLHPSRCEDRDVRVRTPSGLDGSLRVQSTGGAVYLRAKKPDTTQTLKIPAKVGSQ